MVLHVPAEAGKLPGEVGVFVAPVLSWAASYVSPAARGAIPTRVIIRLRLPGGGLPFNLNRLVM